MADFVVFDLETTVPAKDVIEFGAIVLDKRGFYEKESYSTLIFSDGITKRATDIHGITNAMVANSPRFEQIADRIYELMHDKIWVGHNIVKFDKVQLDREFEKLNKKAPEPVKLIDTLVLLKEHFGKRANDHKLASFGMYFGLGVERHRAIDDVRMNIEVLKNCALTLFFERHCELDLQPPTPPDSTPATPQLTAASPSMGSATPSSPRTPASATPPSKSKSRSKTKSKSSSDSQDQPDSDLNENHSDAASPDVHQQSTPTRSKSSSEPISDETRQALTMAMQSQITLWIRYSGGSRPDTPRQLLPKEWKPNSTAMFVAIDNNAAKSYHAGRVTAIGVTEDSVAAPRDPTAALAELEQFIKDKQL